MSKINTQYTTYGVLFAISGGHFINDSIQSVVPAMFPILEKSLDLSYSQLGWIAFMLNMTSSIMQPVFGAAADVKPRPYFLPFAMVLSTAGVIGYALAPNFLLVLLAALFIGLGSAVFHPEGSRVAFMAAGSKRGLAQSIYQMGGNGGQSLAPVFTALLFVPFGQIGALLFTAVTLAGIFLLYNVSIWYKKQMINTGTSHNKSGKDSSLSIPNAMKLAILLLILFVFARSWYSAAITNFYQFYLIEGYGFSIQKAQFYLFAFLGAGVAGTFFGGPLADRFGRKNVLLFSMIGAVPFTLMLPHLPEFAVLPVLIITGFIILSSFSVAVVYAQELLPGKVGMASGLIVGLAFGMGALGAVLFGMMADSFGIRSVMLLAGALPLLGVIAVFLPSDAKLRSQQL
ncbi:MFS transporter [Domibacillus epiphyticus]|uniref:MFS transporter n=1 Tax=Domibacillus epiphyticus TaxID=1714355 RepID=A0A1V2A8J7_9BACI|nr:MFS transporter [Domibacillus epiphyticus]OMP67250.1 MFS transporter [Domibacillus epiphyticus]